MKHPLSIFSLISFTLITTACAAQKIAKPGLQIDTIKYWGIKIDGGCTFYSYDSIDIVRTQHIFIISAKKIAFLSIKEQNDNEYLERIKVENHKDSSRTEIYSGGGIKAVLYTKKTGKRTGYPETIRSGTLTLSGKINQTIKVHGVADEL